MKYKSCIVLAIPATLLLLLLGTIVALPRMHQPAASASKAASPVLAPVTTLAPIVVRPPPQARKTAHLAPRDRMTGAESLPQWKAVSMDWSASGSGGDLTMPYYSFGAAILTRAGD